MVKTSAVVVALCMGSAAAFIPAPLAQTGASATRAGTVMMVEKSKSVPFMPKPAALDISMPGGAEFDPVGFTNALPLPWLLEAEIKHCRVAMLAVLGYIVADFVKLPGDVHQVSSFAAHEVAVKSGALQQINMWVSVAEIISTVAVWKMINGTLERKPGQFFFDPLNIASTPAKFDRYQQSELKNGRLAMLAFSGIITADALHATHGFPYL